MPLIEVKNLHKTYATGSKPLEVLKGVELVIEEGAALAVLGASGAGKSTLLHIIGTLDQPSAGKVLFEGKDPFAYSEKKISEFRNRSLGFVFQFHHLLPMLTALENTMLPLLISGISRKEGTLRASDLLGQVGLSERLHHRPAELSGGEQQRVALARALVMNPRVLLADEPTGNLDSRTGDEVANLLLKLRDEHHMTLVVVTHNEKLAGKLSQKVRLTDGRLLPH